MERDNFNNNLIMTETFGAYENFMHFHSKKDHGLSFLDMLLDRKEFNTINDPIKGKNLKDYVSCCSTSYIHNILLIY